MKPIYERVLLVQPQEELRSYTARLLGEIGFRHVLQASTLVQAAQLLESARRKKQTVQLVVCDDSLSDGALAVQGLDASLPFLTVSDAHNPRNVRLAARGGVSRMVFRPYGMERLGRAVEAALS